MAQMTLRIRELGVQAQNGTYTTADFTNINNEVQALKTGIEGLATNAKYNKSPLLDGAFTADIQFSDESGGKLTVSQTTTNFTSITISAVAAGTGGTTVTEADAVLGNIALARSAFSKQSTTLGYVAAAQSALAEAVDSARSRIEDTDYAAETASMTRNQILQQAATAALAQANAMPNTILSLIK
jgi:flagellin